MLLTFIATSHNDARPREALGLALGFGLVISHRSRPHHPAGIWLSTIRRDMLLPTNSGALRRAHAVYPKVRPPIVHQSHEKEEEEEEEEENCRCWSFSDFWHSPMTAASVCFLV